MNSAIPEVQTSPTPPVTKVQRTHVPLSVLPAGIKSKPNTPELQARDITTLITFITTYCDGRHPAQPRVEVVLETANPGAQPIHLCADCAKLLQHAVVKRAHCPWETKPACKHCPSHCYAPRYRAQIREVMKFSGRKLLLRGRLDYLWHLFF